MQIISYSNLLRRQRLKSSGIGNTVVFRFRVCIIISQIQTEEHDFENLKNVYMLLYFHKKCNQNFRKSEIPGNIIFFKKNLHFSKKMFSFERKPIGSV